MTAGAAPEPKRARDAQRSRVYRAETAVPSSPLPGLPACASFAEKVVGSLWWAARFPEHGLGGIPRFRPGNGARQAFYREEPTGPTITLPRRYRTKGVVLHELVHWALAGAPDLAHHGSTFARVHIDATEEFCGPDRATALEAAYREQRVRIGSRGVVEDGRLVYGADEQRRLARSRSRASTAGGPGFTVVHMPSDHTTTLAAVERFNDAFNRHDVSAVMEAMTHDCVFESTAPPLGTRVEGQDAVRVVWEEFFTTNPTAHFAAEETIVMGDRAVVRWRYTWTDDTGATAAVRGVDVLTARDGKIAEKLAYVKG